MNYDDSYEIIEEYRGILADNFKSIMERNGNNFEDAQFVLESALDLATGDLRNTIYK